MESLNLQTKGTHVIQPVTTGSSERNLILAEQVSGGGSSAVEAMRDPMMVNSVSEPIGSRSAVNEITLSSILASIATSEGRDRVIALLRQDNVRLRAGDQRTLVEILARHIRGSDQSRRKYAVILLEILMERSSVKERMVYIGRSEDHSIKNFFKVLGELASEGTLSQVQKNWKLRDAINARDYDTSSALVNLGADRNALNDEDKLLLLLLSIELSILEKKNARIYFLGEDHSKIDIITAEFLRLSEEKKLIYLIEGRDYTVGVGEGVNESNNNAYKGFKGMDDVLILGLHYFLMFRYLCAKTEEINMRESYLEALWGCMRDMLTILNDIKYVYGLPRDGLDALNALAANFPVLNTTFSVDENCFELVTAAALDLLNWIQNTPSRAFTPNENDSLRAMLLKKDMSLVDDFPIWREMVTIGKRNEVFAANIISTYNEAKASNLPIVITMGFHHINGVSQLLEQQRVSHSHIHLVKAASDLVYGYWEKTNVDFE